MTTPTVYTVSDIQKYDVIVVDGNNIVSNLIEDLTRSIWSHCFIIIDETILSASYFDPKYAVLRGAGKLLSWESILSGPLNDSINEFNTNKTFFGVQARDFSQICAYCKSHNIKMGRRRLKPEQLIKLTETIMTQMFTKYNHDLYELDIFAMFATLWPCITWPRGKKDLFCSEFVSSLLIDVGVLNKDLDPAKVVPSDLAYKFVDEFEDIVTITL